MCVCVTVCMSGKCGVCACVCVVCVCVTVYMSGKCGVCACVCVHEW